MKIDLGNSQKLMTENIAYFLMGTGLFERVAARRDDDKIRIVVFPLYMFEDMIEGNTKEPYTLEVLLPDESTLISEEIVQSKTQQIARDILKKYVTGGRVLIKTNHTDAKDTT